MTATLTRRARLTTALIALFGAFALLFAVLASPASAITGGPTKAEVAFAKRVAPGTELTPSQVEVITEARAVVCEGFAEHVPATRITLTLHEAYGFATDEAHAVMAAVIGYGCAN